MNPPSSRRLRHDFDPIDFLERAVATPSHDGVDEMRDLVGSTLEDAGFPNRVDETGTLIATRGPLPAGVATDDGAHLVLNTHLDTVSPHVPPEWRSDGRRLRGRGACDAKGPLAAMLGAFLATTPDSGRLSLALTPDEETYSTGAHGLVDRSDSSIRDADAVIVGEPTGLDVCTAAPGRYEGTIELGGERAHAAEPEAGHNAVDALADVLDALRSFDDRDDVPDGHPQLGDPTLVPTVVDGGGATNQVPASARVTVDRRPVPPETPASFRRALLAHLREHVVADVDVTFAFADRPTPFLESWATDPTQPLVRILTESSGGSVRPFGAATEASYVAPHAPTVVFGPGDLTDESGPVAHADREYVRVEEVRAAADALATTVSILLGE